MMISPQEYQELEATLELELNRFRPLIPQQDIEAIEHYLKHAEIEMAFESLGLSLMQHRVNIIAEAAETLLKLGLHLNLDKESVFDDKFWDNFTGYLKTHYPS